MTNPKETQEQTLAILRERHPQYQWWASFHQDKGSLIVSLQAERLGQKEWMGYGCDLDRTAESIANSLGNLLYHLDEKVVPVVKALKEDGTLPSDYPEYCYKPQAEIDADAIAYANHLRAAFGLPANN